MNEKKMNDEGFDVIKLKKKNKLINQLIKKKFDSVFRHS